MSCDFNNEIPIYLQIIDDIKNQIICNKYSPMEKIPSVRELSYVYQVNPNTIQKALTELEDMGLIYTERTNGKFVTSDESIINQIKKETINQKINEFMESLGELGLSKKDILKYINKRN